MAAPVSGPAYSVVWGIDMSPLLTPTALPVVGSRLDLACLTNLAEQLAAALQARGQARLVTAESCTGGLIAAACTDLPGSSLWFERGFVTYSNAAKISELGVPASSIEVHGAVSEPVVRAMAQGALIRSGASYAVAVTGVAGPSGGSVQKPVGTVWFAWAGLRGVLSQCRHFEGQRWAVRQGAAHYALVGLLRHLDDI